MFPHLAIDRAFHAYLAQGDDAMDLTEGALLVGAWLRPSARAFDDISVTRSELDALAAMARAHVPTTSALARSVALLAWMTAEAGFRGNDTNYYDLRNSILTEVVRRRTGIPITLAVVYLHLARRLRLDAYGAPIPGHFVVGVATESGPTFLDVFHGVTVSVDELARRTGTSRDSAALASFLAPAPTRRILYRMLQNAKAIALRDNARDTARRLLDWIVALEPGSATDHRDRGMIAYAQGEYGLATSDLIRALPTEGERQQAAITQWLAAMRQ